MAELMLVVLSGFVGGFLRYAGIHYSSWEFWPLTLAVPAAYALGTMS